MGDALNCRVLTLTEGKADPMQSALEAFPIIAGFAVVAAVIVFFVGVGALCFLAKRA